jgi:hypothetical protein
MTTAEKNFILVTESSDTIIVDDYLEELLRKEMRPILWFRDGLFCVVPEAILMNALESIDWVKGDATELAINVIIHWSQGDRIGDSSSHTMYALSGLEY